MRRFIFCLLLVASGYGVAAQRNTTDYLDIHRSVFTVDSHTDTPMRLMDGTMNPGLDNSKTRSCVDFPRMIQGGLDGVFFAVFLSQGLRTPQKHDDAFRLANRIIDTIESVTHRHADLCRLVASPDEAYCCEAENRRAVFLGIENGYAIGNDLQAINHFYNRGVRYITLCHSRNNDICDSSTDTVGYGGLSDFGRHVVDEMNRTGMIVDVSHISDSSFFQVIRQSKVPVIASHSCSRTLCDNPRNVTDQMLLKLKENGGVIQMCILSDYVKKLPRNPVRDSVFKALREKYRGYQGLTEEEMKEAREAYYGADLMYPAELASVADAVDHIDYMVKLIGIDHVGIGTDFDGGGGLSDCRDVAGLPNITRELVLRGYTKSDIRKIWGANLFRVMNEVQSVRQSR